MPYAMTPKVHDSLCRCFALAAIVATCGAGTRVVMADSLVIDGKNHIAVRVTGLADGYLVFRTANGTPKTARLDTLDLITVDRGAAFADFNQAERFVASGEPARAVSRYRRMVHMSKSFWSDLLNARLARATDLAGQIDRATEYFIRVAQGNFSGPATAVHLMPRSIPDRRDGKTARAIGQLLSVSSQLPNGPVRSLLTIYRYELLQRVSDRRAAQAASQVAVLTVDESIGTDRIYAIVLSALCLTLSHEVKPNYLESLNRAIRYAPEARLPDFLLLKGDVLLSEAQTREDYIRASWAYLRVVTHMPDDARAAIGLVGAAAALERMESFTKATALLEECLARADATGTTRERAVAALSRVRSHREP